MTAGEKPTIAIIFGSRQAIDNSESVISLRVTCLVNFQREVFSSVDLRDLMNDLSRLPTQFQSSDLEDYLRSSAVMSFPDGQQLRAGTTAP